MKLSNRIIIGLKIIGNKIKIGYEKFRKIYILRELIIRIFKHSMFKFIWNISLFITNDLKTGQSY